jgi:hypothetical protein
MFGPLGDDVVAVAQWCGVGGGFGGQDGLFGLCDLACEFVDDLAVAVCVEAAADVVGVVGVFEAGGAFA